MDVYQENGFENRREYLDSLAEEFGVAKLVVDAIAEMLGESEDFDGLITALEDYFM